ncbi:MAG: tRNA (adenosine(37)-N6)-threonylcarbamoyltransferase complex dimerization subunit type 1 TsaB [Ruminococcaceae bacterium]|nr:tRNA (adenosine(37)-N6)-threonylcarbamoyltransferase complex dimerization subunit type 1 TsaB [Oscillospiraceae bacterium]
MKILSVECSASPASACVIDDSKVLSSAFVNVKMTHSQTLLPMVKQSLDSAKLTVNDIDMIAVSAGPGSFTGIRIGIAAVKGLAMKNNIPCVAVSTLSAMAEIYESQNAIICAVMDARCNQVYNALFKVNNGSVTRLCEDRALMCEDLANELKTNFSDKNIIITGDGADLFYPYLSECKNVTIADEFTKYQNAIGVGFAAIKEIENGNTVSPAALLPVYLRLPQAERELKKKLENQK